MAPARKNPGGQSSLRAASHSIAPIPPAICAGSITSTYSPTCSGNGALSANGDESAAPGECGLTLIRPRPQRKPRSTGKAAPSSGAVMPEPSGSEWEPTQARMDPMPASGVRQR